jgi:hypothetical protein
MDVHFSSLIGFICLSVFFPELTSVYVQAEQHIFRDVVYAWGLVALG